MKPDGPKHEVPVPSSAWAHGIHQGAGIFFLEGRCHIAAYGSPAEERLLESGALQVASVRFDGGPVEGQRAAVPIHSMRAVAVVDRLRSWMLRN